MMMVLLMQQLMVNTGGQNRKLVRRGGGGSCSVKGERRKHSSIGWVLQYTVAVKLHYLTYPLYCGIHVDSSEWVRKAYKEFCSAFMIGEKYGKDFFYILRYNY